MAVAGRTVAERRPSTGRLAGRLQKRCAKIAEEMPSTAVARRCGARVGLSVMWAWAGMVTPGGRGRARTTSRARWRINGNGNGFRPCAHQSTTLSKSMRRCENGHRSQAAIVKRRFDACPDLDWKKGGESCGRDMPCCRSPPSTGDAGQGPQPSLHPRHRLARVRRRAPAATWPCG